MHPVVVWALQAPTLLNRLATSERWQLLWCDLGDAGGLAERSQCNAERFKGPGRVDYVVVCTELQLKTARSTFPRAKVLWALHNGRADLLPAAAAEVSHFVTFSHRVAAMHAGAMGPYREHKIHVVVPEYEAELAPRGTWSHKRDAAWVMKSRPATRRPDHLRNIRYVSQKSGVTTAIYGQDQERGFLGPAGKDFLMARSTAYLSALPYWAGFGLAEHECLARGTPIVGTRWGDMAIEMPAEYGLDDDLDRVAARLFDLSENPRLGVRLSDLGQEFVRERRSVRRMNRDIERLCDCF